MIEELTSEQEDFILESGMEDYYNKKDKLHEYHKKRNFNKTPEPFE
jgi:hypothetical protein